MNWKQILITILLVMFGIYIFKWVNNQWKIPVIGTVIEEV
jgi:uncharacterized membrane protein